MPTVRQLAVDRSINPNTVSRAHTELELTGLVETQMGSGTFIGSREVQQDEVERQRQSRIILSNAETEITQKFADASVHYKHTPATLHLRAMNKVFEGLKTKGSMIIVPSTAVETMGLGAMGGLTAFDRIMQEHSKEDESESMDETDQ